MLLLLIALIKKAEREGQKGREVKREMIFPSVYTMRLLALKCL